MPFELFTPCHYTIADLLDKDQSLSNFDPCQTESTPGDGNCYFSTISYLITGTRIYHKELSAILVENMLGKLSANCNIFLRTKYIYTQGNYRNVQDWINKMGINRAGKWATDLEVFATSLLLMFILSFIYCTIRCVGILNIILVTPNLFLTLCPLNVHNTKRT